MNKSLKMDGHNKKVIAIACSLSDYFKEKGEISGDLSIPNYLIGYTFGNNKFIVNVRPKKVAGAWYGMKYPLGSTSMYYPAQRGELSITLLEDIESSRLISMMKNGKFILASDVPSDPQQVLDNMKQFFGRIIVASNLEDHVKKVAAQMPKHTHSLSREELSAIFSPIGIRYH